MDDPVAGRRGTGLAFWRGKRVLVTGHTGFKGAWLCHWLLRLGARVTGIALDPDRDQPLCSALRLEGRVDHHVVDIRDSAGLTHAVRQARPEFLFHLAARALVRPSYEDPQGTFDSNVMGTVNVLDAARSLEGLRAAVMVTTDKVYDPSRADPPFDENSPLGGHDPYSASKAACEAVIASYRDVFFRPRGVPIASARAGNAIGGGDWARDRLLPDLVRAWSEDAPARLRNPDALRPWQHVLDPLRCYLELAARLADAPEKAGAFNFGPDARGTLSVLEVAQQAAAVWPGAEIEAVFDSEAPRETGVLTLDCRRAREALRLTATMWPADEAVRRTTVWYRKWLAGAEAPKLCDDDIEAYEKSL